MAAVAVGVVHSQNRERSRSGAQSQASSYSAKSSLPLPQLRLSVLQPAPDPLASSGLLDPPADAGSDSGAGAGREQMVHLNESEELVLECNVTSTSARDLQSYTSYLFVDLSTSSVHPGLHLATCFRDCRPPLISSAPSLCTARRDLFACSQHRDPRTPQSFTFKCAADVNCSLRRIDCAE